MIEAQVFSNNKHLAKSLLNAKIDRVEFDAYNPLDRNAYRVFSETGRWVRHFSFKFPDKNVVAMCQRKLIDYAVRDESVTA